MEGIPALKCGPGRTERSHTPDEYVLESEILDGARFYTRVWVRAYAGRAAGGERGVSRLWDKGEPLDERVLRYTAGEDHAPRRPPRPL